MYKTKTIFLVVLLALAMTSTAIPIIPTASAAPPAFTDISGTLNGANYTARFPSPMNNWNRVLVVYCRGYSHNIPTGPLIQNTTGTSNWALGCISVGAAFAITDFGAGGYCVQQGLNATYELTQYLVSKYKVAKVYLIGVSMGGRIALLLGEKYPKVYSGVMDISGAKNATNFYNQAVQVAGMTNDTELVAWIQSMGAPVPPFPFQTIPPPLSNQLQAIRAFFATGAADIAAELGGPPNAVPQAYQNTDPLSHANIAIPVISVHGTADVIVPYSESLQYQAAVAAAGKSNLYRLYLVDGGQHADAAVQGNASLHLWDLARMSMQLRPLLQATAFCNVTVLPGWTWWFFAQGVGGVGSLTYQWFEGTTLLQGQTSMVLSVTKNTSGKYEFYCQVTDSEGTTINTNTISLTVLS